MDRPAAQTHIHVYRLSDRNEQKRGSKFRFFEKIPNKNDLPFVCVVCLTAVRSRAISKPLSVRVRLYILRDFEYHTKPKTRQNEFEMALEAN